MEPVHGNQRCQLFDWIWNGQAVSFWNAIRNQNRSTSKKLSTIQNLNVFGIQAPTVDRGCNKYLHDE